MQLNKKIAKIAPSATVVLGQKARELRAQGSNIIQLGEGEPDINTPDFIVKAAGKYEKPACADCSASIGLNRRPYNTACAVFLLDILW